MSADSSAFKTGYWADPADIQGGNEDDGYPEIPVHAVPAATGAALCGWTAPAGLEYQMVGNGLHWGSVTCRACWGCLTSTA